MPANNDSLASAVSSDGRYVAFSSAADDLVPNDTNDASDLFLRDVGSAVTERIDVSSSGVQGNFGVYGAAAISADGRYVTFDSYATNFIPGDTHAGAPFGQVYLRDRTDASTVRVSADSAGVEANADSAGPAISADGRFVSFSSNASNLVSGDTNAADDVFVRDMTTGTTSRVSLSSSGIQGNAPSGGAVAISADGRYVTFASSADNLVSGDTNGIIDVFVRDRLTDTTTRVSVSSSGQQQTGPNGWSSRAAISGDGRYVAFSSVSNGLTPDPVPPAPIPEIYRRDLQTSTTSLVSVSAAGAPAGYDGAWDPAISADGSIVSFVSDQYRFAGISHGFEQVYARDIPANVTRLVTLEPLADGNPAGESVTQSLAADGLHAVFSSPVPFVGVDANRRWDVYETELDTTAPDTSIQSGPSGTVASNNASFGFASSESPAQFQCALDGAGLADCASPASYSGLSPGAHTFVVRAMDQAGNVDPTAAAGHWTIAAVSPPPPPPTPPPPPPPPTPPKKRACVVTPLRM